VYPNPCTNTLYIANPDVTVVKLYNQTGTLVRSSSESAIDVSQLKSGVYVVAITNKNGELVTQMVVVQ